jgi:hypothetical protein
MRRHLSVLLPLIASGSVALACTGVIGDVGSGSSHVAGNANAPSGGMTVPPAVIAPAGIKVDAAPAALHRLTPVQYANTVRDLLNLTDADVANINVEQDQSVLPSLQMVTDLDTAAATIVALGAHDSLVPCDVTGPGSDECATQYFTTFASRAFRHPITPDELTWLQGIYASARAQTGLEFSDAIDIVTRVILESPQIFYVYEVGQSDPNLPVGVYTLAPYEMASRLSYLFWDSIPDAQLLSAAAGNQLTTTDEINAQAKRMIADPRAKTKMMKWVSTWLGLDGTLKNNSIEEAIKPIATFPQDSPAMRTAMRTEIEALVGRVWDRNGTMGDLFTSTDVYVNASLATLYGIADGPKDDATWAWMTLDSSQRAGLVTRAAFLMVYSNPATPSPILRGVSVLRNLFCNNFPAPPPTAACTPVTSGVVNGQPVSIRQATDAATASSACQGCHSAINAAGYTLGNFDAYGQYWTHETSNGTTATAAIDTSGELKATDVDVPITGAVQLSQELAKSRDLQECAAGDWWTQTLGHSATSQESASFAYVEAQLGASGKLQDLLTSIAVSPAFRYVRPATNPNAFTGNSSLDVATSSAFGNTRSIK